MRKWLLAGAAALALLSSVPARAQQPDWYVLNGGQCAPAAMLFPSGPSPNAYRFLAQHTGWVETTDVTRAPDGNVVLVVTTVQQPTGGAKHAFLWYPSPQLCELGKYILQMNGN